MWPAVTPHVAFGGLTDDSPLAVLARYGVRPADNPPLARSIHLPDAATAVASQLSDWVDIPLAELRLFLANDLCDRAAVAGGVLLELADDGMDFNRIEFALANSEFWDRHGSDRQIIELGLRESHWHRRAEADEHHRLPPEVEQDMQQANAERNARVVALKQEFKPRARFSVATEVIEAASDVAQAESLANALDSYADLDVKLSALERHVPDVVNAWSRIVEDQIAWHREG
jgi:hypothetical protein